VQETAESADYTRLSTIAKVRIQRILEEADIKHSRFGTTVKS